MNINDQQIKDIEKEIIEAKRPRSLNKHKLIIKGDKKITFATIVYHDNKGNIVIKQGSSSRKKGDNYNQVVGVLLALMRVQTIK